MPDKTIRVMFVDDDFVTGSVMQRNCENTNYHCTVYQEAKECLKAFSKESADIVITDLKMPGMNGFELLSELRDIDNDIPVLVMTGYSSVENAVEAMKRGATDFIKKPFDFEELRLMVERIIKSVKLTNENKLLKKRIRQKRNRYGMIGDTPVMKTLFNTIEKVSEVNCSVIIVGESGTGKELVARALHDYSPRKDQPFVAIDCGALSETLLESELFGHEKGAFTGATQRKIGLMEQADGGTLFLDEICNISDSMQVKLMRAIENQEITRVGATVPKKVDIRVVAASNRNLDHMVEEGKLRNDFYHRLNVVSINVPCLAERRDDIPALVESTEHEFAERYTRKIQGFDSVSLQNLCKANWPGNIRELRNTIERCVILADSPILKWGIGDLDSAQQENKAFNFSEQDFVSLIDLEEQYINHVLQCFKGKKNRAAEVLGIDKTTLWRKLRKYDEEMVQPAVLLQE